MIIEIIIGAIVSGGTLSVAAIVNALAESILGIFRLAWSTVKGVAKALRTFTRFVVKTIQDLIKGFQELLNILKKGWDEIRRIFDEGFGLSRKKYWMSPGFFKFGEDPATFRNFIRLRERADDGYYNILCHGSEKNVIINGRNLKPQELANLIIEQEYQTGEPIRLIACKTGAKEGGFAKELAEILDNETLAPTEKISVDDLGEFIHDKKGKFVKLVKD